MRKLRLLAQLLRTLPIQPGVRRQEKKFQMDLARWRQLCRMEGSDWAVFSRLMWEKKEFRNLFLYRIRFRWLYRTWVALWYRPLETLYLETGEIGGGLFIQHGFATMVAAKSIGENCWINQQVTVGHTGKGCPVIGDNVMITCGAKVLGDITVGDGAVIGANAVVIRDVEPGAVMGGVPARRIK